MSESDQSTYAASFDQAIVGMAISTPDGVLRKVNDALCDFLGRSRSELVGRHFAEITHPDDVEATRSAVANVIAGSTPIDGLHMDKRYRRADGGEVWGALSLRLLRDDQGTPVRFLTQVADITARKRSEEALMASEAQIRSIVGSLYEGVVMIDAAGIVLEMNESAARILGTSVEATLGKPASGLVSVPVDEAGEALPVGVGLIAGAFATGAATYGTVARVRRADGAVRACMANIEPIFRPGDTRPYAVVCSFIDETERLEAEDAVGASEERYRHLAAEVPVGIFRTDREGHCTYVNVRWTEITGQSMRDAAGRGWASAVHPDDRETVFASWAATLERGDELQTEFRVVTDAGDVRWVSVHASVHRDRDGRVEGYLGSVTDLTERVAMERSLRASEEHHRLVLRNLPGTSVAAYDRDLRMLLTDGAYLIERGLDPRSFVGNLLTEILSPDAAAVLEGPMRRALDGAEEATEYHSELTDRHLVVQTVPYRDEEGDIVGVILINRDVTETREARQRQRAAEQRFEIAFDRAPIGMAIVGLDGRFQRVNEAMSEITGHAREQLEATTIAAITHPDDLPTAQASVESLAAGFTAVHAVEKRYIHAGGHPVWVSVRGTTIRDEDGRPLHMLGQVQDITERKRYEDRLQHLADHDPLTGLLNRRGFEKALDMHLAHCRRYGHDGALLVLDLDGFKFVNDTLGHSAGDELIVSVAAALRHRLRETDVLARLGGDEFAVLLPADADDAATVAEAIVGVIRTKAAGLRGQHPGRVTASVGVALFDDPTLTADELLSNADLAMYDAKDAGKDRYALYRSADYDMPKIKAHMTWLDRIERAVETDRFVLHAQPVIDLADGSVAWHEALVRLLGDDGEIIPPATFLYIAERYGAASAVDQWVLTHAIRAMAAEQALGNTMKLSVNVSGASTGDPELLATIERELLAGQLDPGTLILEITETAAVADIPRARQFAESLRELGCQFALDDFGAGYGSFYYLKHLPFDLLKIDGEFVKHCAAGATDQLIIRAVTEIARGLGKQTVAEFVPDDHTVGLLRDLGVDLGQGYHLGKPKPLATLLTASPYAAR